MNAKPRDENAWVETLLQAHPVDLEDEGFSKAVMEDIKARHKRRLWVLAPLFALAAGVLLFVFPWAIFDGTAGAASTALAPFAPFIVPIAAVAVMVLFTFFSEEAA